MQINFKRSKFSGMSSLLLTDLTSVINIRHQHKSIEKKKRYINIIRVWLRTEWTCCQIAINSNTPFSFRGVSSCHSYDWVSIRQIGHSLLSRPKCVGMRNSLYLLNPPQLYISKAVNSSECMGPHCMTGTTTGYISLLHRIPLSRRQHQQGEIN